MFGLQQLNASDINSNNLEVDTLQINVSGNSVTMPQGNNSNAIATTSFVESAKGTMQSTYDNSTQPQIVISTDGGALQIKGNASVSNVLEIQDDGGSNVLEIANNGTIISNNTLICSNLAATTLDAPTITADTIDFLDDVHIEGSSNGRICIGREIQCGSSNAIAMGYRCLYNGGDGSTSISSICIGQGCAQNLPSSCNANNNVLLGTNIFQDISANSDRAYNNIVLGNLAASGTQCRTDSGGVSIGVLSSKNSLGQYGINIGYDCASQSFDNGVNSVCIGRQSCYNGVGDYSIALGYRASYTDNSANSICLNSSGADFSTNQAGFFVKPIREVLPTNHKMLCLNTDTNEITAIQTDDHGLLSANNIWTGSNTFNNAVTFSGSVSGLVKGDVGLGNVTNESKATMFSSPSFTGTATAPTPSINDDSTKIATTAFVKNWNGSVTRQTGVYMGYNVGSKRIFWYPMYYSVTNLANRFTQDHTSGTTDFNRQLTTESAAGSWGVEALNDIDDFWLVFPGWGLVGYDSTGYTGDVFVNYKNETFNPVMIRPSTVKRVASVRVFYNDVEEGTYPLVT